MLVADWTNPADWAVLCDRIGIWGFFALVLLLLIAFALRAVLRWTIGENGFVRAGIVDLFGEGKALVSDLRSGLADLQTQAGAQRLACQREATATEQLRTAGLGFAKLGGAIGLSVGADVQPHVEAISRALQPADR